MNLTYETIAAAVAGENDAIEEVLAEYEPYIKSLSMVTCKDKHGREKKIFSPDVYQMLQQKLIQELPKWRGIVK